MKKINLKNAAIAVCVITLSAMCFLVSGRAQTDNGAAQADAAKFTDAATYYKSGKCVVCHGQKAEKKFNTEMKDEDMVQIILKGKKAEKPPHMPAYEPKGITEEQAKMLLDYMKSLKQ